MSIPKTTKAWTIQGQNGFDSLVFNEQTPVPALSDNDVLVKIHAVSLNFRDLIIPLGQYPQPIADGIIPGSDGAGEVIAVGSRVTRFTVGARVATLFSQTHIGGESNLQTMKSALGGSLDGTLRQYGVFNENGLVALPESLNWVEGSTLSCAALTAWNGLYGLKPLAPGDYVLTQGTGGVSTFAVQFAKAAGAIVIATTSSAAKAEGLKKLGADHVINYKNVRNWGEAAKKLTPGGVGVDHVIEVGGASTMAQSLKSIRIGGVISIIGFVGGPSHEQPSFLEALYNMCIVRGTTVGNRGQFEDMNRAIEANKIKPIVDKKVFKFEELKEAYKYMYAQKHSGKLCVRIE